jgi:transketolase
MRTAFINQLIEEASTNDKVFLLVGDLGFNVVEAFAQLYPDRFLNVGIAEQNMVGIAAGLSMEGYCVFIYSIGNFPTLRCMEQIRYDVCYHNMNVKVVAVGGGYAYGSLGVSHHATEELGMLRTIPNLIVCAPGDPFEAIAITRFSARHQSPVYIRLGKTGEPNVHAGIPYALATGEILEARKGKDTAIFSTGAMLKYVCDFVDENKITASVYSFPFVKPINDQKLLQILENYKQIITIEEHQLQAGFGSAILEKINDYSEQKHLNKPPKVKRIAVPDIFINVAGSQEFLRLQAGLVLKKTYFDIK